MPFELQPAVRYQGAVGPPHRALEMAIGTAVIDPDFRESLLRSPAVAATEFGISQEEEALLGSVEADSLETLASYVYSWITRSPKPRKAAFRWTSVSEEAVEVAV